MAHQKFSFTHNLTLKFLLSIVFFFPLSEIRSQSLSHYRITLNEGLPVNEIYSILEDHEGFIWIGCDAGLFRYNGIDFIKYSNEFQQARAVTGLCESSSGRIYCYNFKSQIFYIDNGELHFLRTFKNKLNNITCDRSSNLWVASENKLYIFNERKNKWGSINEYATDEKKSDLINFKNCVTDNQNNIWVISGQNIGQFRADTFFQYKVELTKESPQNIGQYMLCSSNKQMFLFSILNGFVFYFNGEKFVPYPSTFLKNALKNRKITNIKQLKDGMLWITSFSGVVKYDIEKEKGELFFPQYSFSDVLISNDGQYWFSSPNSGMFVVSSLKYRTYDQVFTDNSSRKITKLIQNKDKLIYATEGGQTGILNTSTNTVRNLNLENQTDIQVLNYDSIDQEIYLCTNNYIYRQENDNWVKLKNEFTAVKAFLHVNDKYVLASSSGCYVYKDLESNQPSVQITKSWSRDLVYDYDAHELWVATNNGLKRVRNMETDTIKLTTFLDSTQIISIDKNKNKLYVLCFDGRIYEFDNKNSSEIIANLPANAQGKQIKIHQNKLYIASNLGLFVYDIENGILQKYDKFSGILSNDIQAIEFTDQNIWLATGNGLQKLPLEILSNFKPPIFKMSFIYIDDQAIENSQNISLLYNQSLSFIAEAITYRSKGNFQFAYRILNQDSTWRYVPALRGRIEIVGLPYGHFTIEFKAVDYWDNSSTNIVKIDGELIPPFWQRWWFYLLIGLFALWVSTVGYLRRVRQLKHQQSIEIARLNIENELRLSQQAALKAQMNPHFIFNVLNSIKAYIYENDKKNAVKYLSSFSDLIRSVLEMSSEQFVRIQDEIRLCKLYVELESILLEDDFEFNLQIDPELEAKRIDIPALFIQPFIENSFKHGLRHKKGMKKLKLSFKLDRNENVVLVCIEDNGVGRKESALINAQSLKTHTSFATQAIEKRMVLLNSGNTEMVQVEIIDLIENKSAKGTKVQIKFHMNESE